MNIKLRSIILTLAYSVIFFLLHGCVGEDGRSKVAKEFAYAVSQADFEKVKRLSSENVHEGLDDIRSCVLYLYNESRVDAEGLHKTALINKAKKGSTDSESTNNLRKFLSKQLKVLREMSNKAERRVRDKYGERYSSLKYKIGGDIIIKDDYLAFLSEDLNNAVKPSVVEEFKMLGIKTKTDKELVIEQLNTLIIEMATNNDHRISAHLKERMMNYIGKNYDVITPECIDAKTKYGFITSINLLEIIEKAADKAEVRLELIDNEDNSEKVRIGVEKIKGDWKVVVWEENQWRFRVW